MATSPVLYFAPGTCARVSLTALEEIGEPFETRLLVFMKGDHRAPDFLAVNPSGKVPALVTDEGTITQNSAILWYLAARYPEAELLPRPSSPMEAAELIAQLSHFSADLHPLVTRIVMPVPIVSSPEAEMQLRENGAQGLTFHLRVIEQTLADRPWLLGERWSVLDSYLGWVWFRTTGAGFDGSEFSRIGEHYARLNERPAVKRCIAREAAAQAELVTRGLAPAHLKNV
ncbi:MAG: glutathione S-transferase family protein [Alphaproteobacteria bacterium]|nr:glutathione S-transferase family protein [Alphaproteobacteria bacterium]MBU0792997.1 glutathione S-transferase family protein [Alphaproteobacteria bacterium]MBU0875137.1 glutathione S-transferase family protein [Alphaproteobacteria bacterium]MBU1768886.1 glutathione S-transferase family protein [Alphaproteobacteria bacterium]